MALSLSLAKLDFESFNLFVIRDMDHKFPYFLKVPMFPDPAFQPLVFIQIKEHQTSS